MSSRPLSELYTKLSPEAAEALLLPERPREVGHFNVFNVADLMLANRDRPPMTFDRRAFYKISLIRGRSRIEFADQVAEVTGGALWFASSRVPYRWLPHDQNQTGHFCIFTEEFLQPTKGRTALEELPFYQPGAYPIVRIADPEFAAIEAIFQKMEQEIASDFAYKYDLLRAYLLEMVYYVQKLQPAPAAAPTQNASARLTAQFADLLERQFPLESPQQRLRLRTATDYAAHLAVHVNHLNRVLKDTTGQTTTALISSRVGQEAKILLKQTSWTVSEIADSLSFADVAHFCNFFKRQTGLTPGDFRG
ncbi:helix-turn-helix domain-containing protein [Hymenobacter convexus]|uniref:helix-turn-helix domain-containing protein n=1 Tax=Hymenobacter sp. CA1UV-4 TaxID=3063782 RepID=UPI002713CC9D|nr:helix-turn-helix transcriptional regulator [Hymenobacter sp. CA1UV-4]MDO7853335.1 helix-turn-helix transcriptional regulator [Hymenobacter sp. CA1UV-4]